MAVTDSDPTDGPFDYHAGDGDDPSDNALNLASRLRERDEIRRLAWISSTGAVKVETEDVESTLYALDFNHLTVEVMGTFPLEVTLFIEV